TVEVIVTVGGEDDKVVLRSVESFDPVTNHWKNLACLPFAVSKHGLVVSGLVMLDGFVYAVGGWEGRGRLDSVECYNPHTNSWQFTPSVKMAVTSPAVVALDGLLYVTGVNHSVLRQVGEGLLSVRSGTGAPVAKAAYRGGELRVQNRDELVHVLVVSEGAVTGTAEANAFTVLQRILGAGPHVKRGSSFTSKLSQGVAKSTAQPNQVKAEYLMSIESSEGLMEEIGAQVLSTAAYQAPESVLQAIDTITKNDVVMASRRGPEREKRRLVNGLIVPDAIPAEKANRDGFPFS
ncbi:hypothetical protein XENOCAPTIV_027052, partial [Xenoophorus captivus]